MAWLPLSLVGVGLALAADETNTVVAQFFYVWISVLNLFIVSVFWSFLLEMFDANQTRRLFGVIAAGGTTGALVGPLLTDLTVTWIGNPGVLFMGAGFFVIAIICQRTAARRVVRHAGLIRRRPGRRTGPWAAIRSPASRWC